jgi:predicted nucleic acid-binding protein
VSILIDTGVLLDYLSGVPQARDSIDRYSHGAISVLTWIELMSLAPEGKEEATRDFLRRFERLALNEAIADRAALVVRAHSGVTLSFAITYATARINSLKLVTVDVPVALRDDANIETPYLRPGAA